MNVTVLVGRVVADPEVSTIGEGKKLAKFSLAVDRGGDKGEAGFFRIEAWDESAEFAEKYLTKGKPIGLSGVLKHHRFTDKEGQKRESVFIQCNGRGAFTFMPFGPKAEGGEATTAAATDGGAPATAELVPDEDDLLGS